MRFEVPLPALFIEEVSMKALTCAALVLLFVSPLSAAGKLDRPTGESIVSPDATLQKLYTREAKIKGGLTEGPAAAPDGSIYFSDIPIGSAKKSSAIPTVDTSTHSQSGLSLRSPSSGFGKSTVTGVEFVLTLTAFCQTRPG